MMSIPSRDSLFEADVGFVGRTAVDENDLVIDAEVFHRGSTSRVLPTMTSCS
jgi:hypothetical protein